MTHALCFYITIWDRELCFFRHFDVGATLSLKDEHNVEVFHNKLMKIIFGSERELIKRDLRKLSNE